MLDTKKRDKQIVDFVDYLVDGSSILVAADSKVQDLTLDKMCGFNGRRHSRRRGAGLSRKAGRAVQD